MWVGRFIGKFLYMYVHACKMIINYRFVQLMVQISLSLTNDFVYEVSIKKPSKATADGRAFKIPFDLS